MLGGLVRCPRTLLRVRPTRACAPPPPALGALGAQDAPSLLGGGGSDAPCYQVVITFGATAEALAKWKAQGSAAARMFARFVANAPEGVMPSSGDLDIKERLKLTPRIDNMSSLGIPGWIAGYNGKPALITKSGARDPAVRRHRCASTPGIVMTCAGEGGTLASSLTAATALTWHRPRTRAVSPRCREQWCG